MSDSDACRKSSDVASNSSLGTQINLNTASDEELMAIHGVGFILSSELQKERVKRPFDNMNDMLKRIRRFRGTAKKNSDIKFVFGKEPSRLSTKHALRSFEKWYQRLLPPEQRKKRGSLSMEDYTISSSKADKWQVRSPSGDTYDLHLFRNEVSCTCPDSKYRGVRCKHVFMVLRYLHSRFETLELRLQKFLVGHPDKECLICFGTLQGSSVYDCPHCNLPTHMHCAQYWNKINPTCPVCRRLWDDRFLQMESGSGFAEAQEALPDASSAPEEQVSAVLRTQVDKVVVHMSGNIQGAPADCFIIESLLAPETRSDSFLSTLQARATNSLVEIINLSEIRQEGCLPMFEEATHAEMKRATDLFNHHAASLCDYHCLVTFVTVAKVESQLRFIVGVLHPTFVPLGENPLPPSIEDVPMQLVIGCARLLGCVGSSGQKPSDLSQHTPCHQSCGVQRKDNASAMASVGGFVKTSDGTCYISTAGHLVVDIPSNNVNADNTLCFVHPADSAINIRRICCSFVGQEFTDLCRHNGGDTSKAFQEKRLQKLITEVEAPSLTEEQLDATHEELSNWYSVCTCKDLVIAADTASKPVWSDIALLRYNSPMVNWFEGSQEINLLTLEEYFSQPSEREIFHTGMYSGGSRRTGRASGKLHYCLTEVKFFHLFSCRRTSDAGSRIELSVAGSDAKLYTVRCFRSIRDVSTVAHNCFFGKISCIPGDSGAWVIETTEEDSTRVVGTISGSIGGIDNAIISPMQACVACIQDLQDTESAAASVTLLY